MAQGRAEPLSSDNPSSYVAYDLAFTSVPAAHFCVNAARRFMKSGVIFSPAAIRLDIVMVPIDGTYTMSLDGVSDITKRLRASVVLPMHRFMTPLDQFMRKIGEQFAIDVRTERTLVILREPLPGTPMVIILDGV